MKYEILEFFNDFRAIFLGRLGIIFCLFGWHYYGDKKNLDMLKRTSHELFASCGYCKKGKWFVKNGVQQ